MQWLKHCLEDRTAPSDGASYGVGREDGGINRVFVKEAA